MKRVLSIHLHALSAAAALSLAVLVACGDEDGATSPDAGVTSPDASVPPDGGAPGAPDSGARPELAVAQAAGEPGALAVAGDRTYVGVGARLEIWETTKDRAPARLGVAPPVLGRISGVAVEGAHVYVAALSEHGSKLQVLDVATATAPAELAALDVPAPARIGAVLAHGGHLYVTDTEAGLHVYDVSDPRTPRLLRTVERFGATALEASATRLYVGAGGFIGTSAEVYDLDDPREPLGHVDLFDMLDFAVTPDDLLVAAGATGAVVLDVRDLAAQTELARNELLASRTVAARSGAAFVAAEDGLHVLDLSERVVTPLGPFTFPTEGALAAAVDGDRLVFATDRAKLVAIDTTFSAAPRGAGTAVLGLCTDCTGLAIEGETVVAASGHGALGVGTLAALERTATARPETRGDVVFESVALQGGVAYVADWEFGLRIVDVSDRLRPRFLGEWDSLGYPSAVGLAGDRLFLGESTNGGQLRILDVGDPARPRQLGAAPTSKTRDLAASGALAITGDEPFDAAPGGVRVFDVSAPERPTLLATYGGCTTVLGVALHGELAAAACDLEGVHLLDLADPRAPRLVAAWTPEGIDSAWSVALDDRYVYAGTARGVQRLRSNGTATLQHLEELPTAFTVRRVVALPGGRIVAAAGPAGLYQWQRLETSSE